MSWGMAAIPDRRAIVDRRINETTIDVIVEVLPYAAQVVLHFYAVFLQVIGIADTRKHEQVGRTHDAGTQNHVLACVDPQWIGAVPDLHSSSSPTLNGYTAYHRAGLDRQVLA